MKRVVAILFLLGSLPACVSHDAHRDEIVAAVVEIRGFVPFERRVNFSEDGKGTSGHYEFHRLDFRVLKPESHGKVISVLLPLQDWPAGTLTTPGRIFSVRLKAKDLAGAADTALPEYRLADLQAKEEPNQSSDPTRGSGP